MSRAKELFEKIRKEGISAIASLISDLELESMFLDYKGTSDKLVDANLSKGDNENLAKCVSGFANSYGGVIVWGIDSRPDRTTGAEVITNKPLANAHVFGSKIQNAITRVTIPPHDGVEVEIVIDPERAPIGYVAVYVPSSRHRPIRAVPRDTYLMRAGSNFVPIPHDSLRLLFGAKPESSVELDGRFYSLRRTEKEDHLHFALGLNVANSSFVIAENPYIVIKHSGLSETSVHVSELTTGYEEKKGPYTKSLVPTSRHILPPSGVQFICNLGVSVHVKSSADISLEIVVGAESIFPTHYFLRAPIASLFEAYPTIPSLGGVQADRFFKLERDT